MFSVAMRRTALILLRSNQSLMGIAKRSSARERATQREG